MTSLLNGVKEKEEGSFSKHFHVNQNISHCHCPNSHKNAS
jgi:hypothetical protein